MKNFPNFDFEQWLEKYYLTYLFFSYPQRDEELMESEKFILKDMKDSFYQQLHLANDDNWSHTEQYLQLLTNFTNFCRLFSDMRWTTEDIIHHFWSIRFKNIKNLRSIIKAFLSTEISSYVAFDKHRNEVIFGRHQIENIKDFLIELTNDY